MGQKTFRNALTVSFFLILGCVSDRGNQNYSQLDPALQAGSPRNSFSSAQDNQNQSTLIMVNAQMLPPSPSGNEAYVDIPPSPDMFIPALPSPE